MTPEQLHSYLDTSHIRLTEFCCFVALSPKRDTIWWCPMNADGTPERDGVHMDWTEVTAPEPDFVRRVNELYGTAFECECFAGR